MQATNVLSSQQYEFLTCTPSVNVFLTPIRQGRRELLRGQKKNAFICTSKFYNDKFFDERLVDRGAI